MSLNKTILYMVILFVGYGLILFIPIGNIQIPIPVIYETAEIFWTQISLVTLLDIFITPPFMIIMFYYVHKSIITQPKSSPEPSQHKKDILRFVFFGAAIILVSGIVIHASANVLNGILGNPVPPSDPLQAAIYFFDEVLGHKLIHCAIMTFLIGLMVVQYWHRSDPQLAKYDIAGLYVWPFAIGGVYAIAAIEGQAGFDLMVISIVLIIIIAYYVKFKGLNLKENLFTQYVLEFLIAIVIVALIWGLITGFIPGYPFFKQPSTL